MQFYPVVFDLLYKYPEIHLNITKSLANRLYYKAIIASEISSQEPEHRVLRFFDYLKNDVYKVSGDFTFKINYLWLFGLESEIFAKIERK